MHLISIITRCREDRRGATTTVFAFVLTMLLASTGTAIDFGLAHRAQSDLQRAADAGVLAAASIFRSGGDEPQARRAAESQFRFNKDDLNLAQAVTVDTRISDSNVVLVGTTEIRTHVLTLVGIDRFPIRVEAESAVEAQHVDVHVLFDVTGSMNIPDAAADIARFSALFRPYGGTTNCSFACHLATPSLSTGEPPTFNGKTGFDIARENGIYLREDRLRDSLVTMLRTISAHRSAPNIRVALKTFSWGPTEYAPLSSDYSALISAASNIVNRSAGTNASNTLRLAGQSLSGGNGTRTNPKQIVVLITDGIEQNMVTAGAGEFDTTACSEVKSRGVEIIVVGLAYPNPNSLQGSPAKVEEYRRTIEQAPAKLAACASPGRIYDARDGAAIAAAFDSVANAVVSNKAVSLAR